MPELNINLPSMPVLVRETFLYDLDPAQKGVVHGQMHAAACISGRAIGFHVLLDNGAHIGRLPIHALYHKAESVDGKRPVVETPVNKPWHLQLWNCFSYQAECIVYDWLDNMRCRVALGDGSMVGGSYYCTIDYYGGDIAESAGDAGWKCHHLILLDDGRIAAQPNNRVCFYEPSSVVPFEPDSPPKYRTMTSTWDVEDGAKWRTSDDDKMFYGVEQIDKPE